MRCQRCGSMVGELGCSIQLEDVCIACMEWICVSERQRNISDNIENAAIGRVKAALRKRRQA